MAFVSGSSTAFGYFDSDPQFRTDAERVLKYVTTRLGESQLQVELSSSDVYRAFEAATMEYSAIINRYQTKSVLGVFLGTPTGSLTGAENKYPQFSLEWARRQSEAYNDLANLNSRTPFYSGSVGLQAGQQQYDLQTLINPTGSDGQSRRMIVKDIYHTHPFSAFRFWGTTSFINYLNNEFKFESYTPETVFYLLPVWEDILRGMQFETSNRVRRSNYSYEMHNNVLTLYPTPTSNVNLWFTYQLADNSPVSSTDSSSSGVANMSNIPFGNLTYALLNSISRQWIFEMTLSISTDILGHVRRKMGNIPIPNGSLDLDGDQLVSDAKDLADRLRTELKEMLEELTYDKIAAREAEKAAALEETLKKVPMLGYTG